MNSYIYALGFFDGVHIGHQALLLAARELGAENGISVGVVTFTSHPDTLVFGRTPPLINTYSDRKVLLQDRFGAEHVVELPFDEKMCSTPWQVFLEMLRREYGASGFVCGADFRFGKRGQGTASLLEEYCRTESLPCCVVPEQTLAGVRVSSTHIRSLLMEGNAEQAMAFLGHPHLLSGTVVSGRQLGRKLGIPTANLRLPGELVIPRFGVYACIASVDGKKYPAVTNVGTRPTVEGHHVTVEPWILDFEGDLYGQEITLEFYSFLRPEQKFPSLEVLQATVFRNADETRDYFARHPEALV